jgi:hypothetical protein
MAGEVVGNLQNGSVKDQHVAANANLSTSKFVVRSLVNKPVELARLRTWDAQDVRLPGVGVGVSGANPTKEGLVAVTYRWTPSDTNDAFFVALRNYRVVGITARVEVAGTDAGAVTAVVNKAASGTAVSAGTTLHTGTINLKGTAATNQALTLSATSATLDIPAGTAIGFAPTGTMTNARGSVTVLLAPENQSDDLLLVTGAYGSFSSQAQTGDLAKAGATTRRARVVVDLPDNYVSGGNVTLRAVAGMTGHVADTAATVQIEAYQLNDDGSLSSNLAANSALNCNSLTLANYDFALTTSNLLPGSRLDVRVSLTVNDGGGASPVNAVLQNLYLRCDVQP